MATIDELVDAASRNDVSAVHALVESASASVLDEQTASGDTALAAACANGSVHAVDALLSFGASLHTHTRAGNSALRSAVAASQHEVVDLLLRHGADANEETSRGSALSAACASGDAEIVRTLVQHGATPDREDRSGFSPLMLAVSRNNASLVQVLLSAPADPQKASDTDGRSALDLAEERGFTDIVALLMKHVVRSTADATLQQSRSRTVELVHQIEREAESQLDAANREVDQLEAESKSTVDALRNENDELLRRLGVSGGLGFKRSADCSNIELSRTLAQQVLQTSSDTHTTTEGGSNDGSA